MSGWGSRRRKDVPDEDDYHNDADNDDDNDEEDMDDSMMSYSMPQQLNDSSAAGSSSHNMGRQQHVPQSAAPPPPSQRRIRHHEHHDSTDSNSYFMSEPSVSDSDRSSKIQAPHRMHVNSSILGPMPQQLPEQQQPSERHRFSSNTTSDEEQGDAAAVGAAGAAPSARFQHFRWTSQPRPSSPGNTSLSSWESPGSRKLVQLQFGTPTSNAADSNNDASSSRKHFYKRYQPPTNVVANSSSNSTTLVPPLPDIASAPSSGLGQIKEVKDDAGLAYGANDHNSDNNDDDIQQEAALHLRLGSSDTEVMHNQQDESILDIIDGPSRNPAADRKPYPGDRLRSGYYDDDDDDNDDDDEVEEHGYPRNIEERAVAADDSVMMTLSDDDSEHFLSSLGNDDSAGGGGGGGPSSFSHHRHHPDAAQQLPPPSSRAVPYSTDDDQTKEEEDEDSITSKNKEPLPPPPPPSSSLLSSSRPPRGGGGRTRTPGGGGHRRRKSGDQAAAMLAAGSQTDHWAGHEQHQIPLPHELGGPDEEEDDDDDDERTEEHFSSSSNGKHHEQQRLLPRPPRSKDDKQRSNSTRPELGLRAASVPDLPKSKSHEQSPTHGKLTIPRHRVLRSMEGLSSYPADDAEAAVAENARQWALYHQQLATYHLHRQQHIQQGNAGPQMSSSSLSPSPYPANNKAALSSLSPMSPFATTPHSIQYDNAAAATAAAPASPLSPYYQHGYDSQQAWMQHMTDLHNLDYSHSSGGNPEGSLMSNFTPASSGGSPDELAMDSFHRRDQGAGCELGVSFSAPLAVDQDGSDDDVDDDGAANVRRNRITFAPNTSLDDMEKLLEDREYRNSYQHVRRSLYHLASPLANLGKRTLPDKVSRSSFLPESSVVADDPQGYNTYMCPRCKTHQREFFGVEDAPRQLDGASGYLGIYFGIYVAASLFIFGLEEGWMPLDCVYFAAITLTTAGLGDFVPTTYINKIVCSIFIYFGVACIGLLLGTYIANILDDRAHRRARKNQLDACPNCKRLQTIQDATEQLAARKSPFTGSGRKLPATTETAPRRSSLSGKALSERLICEDKRRVDEHRAKYIAHSKSRHRHEASTSNFSLNSDQSKRSQHGIEFTSPSCGAADQFRKRSNSQGTSDSSLRDAQSLASSQQSQSRLLGSPITRQILGRQLHTRHASMDVGGKHRAPTTAEHAFSSALSGQRGRKYSEDLAHREMTPTIAEDAPLWPGGSNQRNGYGGLATHASTDEESDGDADSVVSSSGSQTSEEEVLDETTSKIKAAKYVFLTLRRALVNSLVIIAVGCLGFYVVEGFALIDSWYFTTVLLTTVGYGDIVPVTRGGKLFATIYLLVAGTVLINNMSEISMIPIELRRRKIERAVLAQFGDQLDDPALKELATGPVIQRLNLAADRTDGLNECTREMFSLAMLVRLGKVSEDDIKGTFAAFRRLDVNDEGVLNSRSIINGMYKKRKEQARSNPGTPMPPPPPPPPPPVAYANSQWSPYQQLYQRDALSEPAEERSSFRLGSPPPPPSLGTARMGSEGSMPRNRDSF